MGYKFSWAESALWRLILQIVAIYPMLLGGVILVGGHERFAYSKAFAVLSDWAPYWAWGGGLLALSVLGLLKPYLCQLGSFFGIASWFWIWEAALVAPTLDNPQGPLTGICTYFCVALVYTGFAVATFMDREAP